MEEQKRIFRFAPSPNGELHLGHAFSALFNLKMARETGGKCLLRIENIDTVRCTPELEKQMLEDLEWIGFEWDEEPRRQSEYFDDYREALDELKHQGLLYPSTLSRSEIRKRVAEKDNWPTDPDNSPIYPGTERDLNFAAQNEILNSGNAYALRLDMSKAVADKNFTWQEQKTEVPASPLDWGDVVLARKDTPTSYHLCCVVDDAVQGITDVVRGHDLFYATSIHRVLQEKLNLTAPRYHHHTLINDDDGAKLSKSLKSQAIRALKKMGLSPQELRQRLSLNWQN